MQPRPVSRAAYWAYVAVIVFLVICPVWYALTGAFRATDDGSLFGQFWVKDFTLENFATAFSRMDLQQQLFNSVVVTIAQTLLQLITAILAAAALVFGGLRNAKLIFGIIMGTMFIPSEAIVVARFVLVNDMGLFDTLLAVFLPFAAMAFPIFLLRQAFLSFPSEIREAALLDGVGPLRFVFSFLIPLTKPALFTVTLTSAIAAWNGYMWPLLITDTKARTLQVGISQLSDANSTDVGVVLAGVTMVSIPLILLVIFGQKFLTRGLTEGSNK